ncbi:MAG: O-antigen ligase family protein [Saprospiraceae bacterium]|nr:O-antigen ligase family protein [Saprospiraceae bacterium]
MVQSLAWSKFTLSISLWGLAVVSIFKFQISNFKLQTLFSPSQYFSHFWRNKSLVVLTIPFLLVLISGLWSENMVYWLERMRIKLPFLILPFAFANLPPLSKKQFWGVFYVFVVAFSIFCARHLFFYVQHFAEVNRGLGQGIPIPTHWNHISFATMAVFAFLSGLELWKNNFYWRYPKERFFIGGLVVFLFVALHVLSVRSAILSLYICVFFQLLELVFNQKRWKIGLLSLTILTIMPYLAYRTIPSLRQRIDYAIWDYGQYKQGDLTLKSDSERITTLKMGVAAFRQSPVWGIGYGDIMDEVSRQYKTYFPQLDVREPHSFWLFSLIGTGIVGTFIFVMAFATHWFHGQLYRIGLFSLLHFLILFTNTIDFVVEGTYGAVFYAFFVAFFVSQNTGKVSKY